MKNFYKLITKRQAEQKYVNCYAFFHFRDYIYNMYI